MLIPLGVLALGAMFSGMIWYKVFFGDEEKLRDWFGMEQIAVHHEDPAAAPAEGDHAATTVEGDHAAAPAEDATAEADPAAAPAADDHAAAHAPKGALLILPYGTEEQALVDSRVDAAKVEASGHAPNTIIAAAHMVPSWVKVSPFIAMLIGLAISWLFYIRNPSLPGRLAAQQRPLYLFLLNKWYFDELYDAIFVRPAKWLGNFLWKQGDGKVIDGTLNGVAMGIIPFFTRLAGRAQSGYLFHYAFAMVLGIVILVTWMVLSGGVR